jgi:pyruvate kinase
VSDAANAVYDRVDAIMLAGETAIGAYPVRSVQTLALVIRDAESVPSAETFDIEDTHILPAHGRAICDAAATLAANAQAAAIVAVTRGGKTARVLSALRPPVPVYAATDDGRVAQRLALSWGVAPVLTELGGDVNAAASRIGQELVERGSIPPASAIVVVSVTPDLAPGPSNFLKLQRV